MSVVEVAKDYVDAEDWDDATTVHTSRHVQSDTLDRVGLERDSVADLRASRSMDAHPSHAANTARAANAAPAHSRRGVEKSNRPTGRMPESRSVVSTGAGLPYGATHSVGGLMPQGVAAATATLKRAFLPTRFKPGDRRREREKEKENVPSALDDGGRHPPNCANCPDSPDGPDGHSPGRSDRRRSQECRMSHHDVIMRRWKLQAFVQMHLHQDSHYFYRSVYALLSVPLIVLTTVASATVFASRDSTVNYVVGSMNVGATVLAGLIWQFQPAELSQQHTMLAQRYRILSHTVESMMKTPYFLREDVDAFMKNTQNEMDTLVMAQVDPPALVMRKHRRVFGPISAILYGDDVVAALVNNLKTSHMVSTINRESRRIPTSQKWTRNAGSYFEKMVLDSTDPRFDEGPRAVQRATNQAEEADALCDTVSVQRSGAEPSDPSAVRYEPSSLKSSTPIAAHAVSPPRFSRSQSCGV